VGRELRRRSVSAIRSGVPRLETIKGISRPFGIAAGQVAVWVGSNTDSTVTRIEPDTRRNIAEIMSGASRPTRAASSASPTGAGFVWALNRIASEVVRIDPRTNDVVARIPLGPGVEPRTLHVAGDAVWLSVGTPGFDARRAGRRSESG
jgi:hypothetical protein